MRRTVYNQISQVCSLLGIVGLVALNLILVTDFDRVYWGTLGIPSVLGILVFSQDLIARSKLKENDKFR